MTLAIAWLRTVSKSRELVVAADSRLRWGRAWDCCPKIIPLPRLDSVICFSGDTMYAYPMMIQVVNAVTMHPKTLSRATDITDLNGHLLRVLNEMHDQIHDLPKGSVDDKPEVLFLLAGYSWKVGDFRIWEYSFARNERKFSARRAGTHQKRTNGTKYSQCVGDHVGDATGRLYEMLAARGKLKTGGLDMEPLEVLVEFIRNEEYPTIGGPPQVVKIYRHSNFLPHNVYWPDRASGVVTLFGRRLLDYEKRKFLTLDPDTMEIFEPDGNAISKPGS